MHSCIQFLHHAFKILHTIAICSHFVTSPWENNTLLNLSPCPVFFHWAAPLLCQNPVPSYYSSYFLTPLMHGHMLSSLGRIYPVDRNCLFPTSHIPPSIPALAYFPFPSLLFIFSARWKLAKTNKFSDIRSTATLLHFSREVGDMSTKWRDRDWDPRMVTQCW